MKLSTIEKQVIANMHNLPLEKQHSILEFSAFLKNNTSIAKANTPSFSVFLKEFELDPLDIDTAMFDNDRAKETDRKIEL